MIGDISHLITEDNYQLSNVQKNKLNFPKFLFSKLRRSLTNTKVRKQTTLFGNRRLRLLFRKCKNKINRKGKGFFFLISWFVKTEPLSHHKVNPG